MTETLTVSGWIFMTGAWLLIIILNIYCFYQLFREKKQKIVGLLEVETQIDELEK